MLKKIISWMLPFFIYNLIVLLLILLMFLLPIGSDIVLLIGWGLYIPYIYFVIYILGFIFGYFIQARSLVQSIKLQLILAIIFDKKNKQKNSPLNAENFYMIL